MSARTLFVRRDGLTLVPAGRTDAEVMEMLPPGVLHASLSRRRTLPAHRRYWGILHLAIRTTKAGEIWPSAEHLHKSLRLMTGRATPVKAFVGGVWTTAMIPESSAFAAESQDEFLAYVAEALPLLSGLIGVDVETLQSEAEGAADA